MPRPTHRYLPSGIRGLYYGAALVQRTALREGIARQRQPLVLHADNGSPMRRATIVQKPAYVHRTDARAPAAPSWGAFTSSAGRGQIQPFAGLKANEAGVDGMVTNPATTNALTEASGRATASKSLVEQYLA